MFLMIELPEVPRVGRVACVAVFAQGTFVMVVLLVTAHAIAAGAGELITDVAVLAGHYVVQTYQWEVGEVVVESVNCFPAVCDVAGGTHLHLGIFMYVISGVAGGAVARQVILQGSYVAAGASKLLMVASEGESGFPGMIEFRLFPLDRCVAGLALLAVAAQMNIVIGVTAVAVRRDIFLHHTVGMAGAAG